MIRKHWFQLLVYISLLFLLFKLSTSGLLAFPESVQLYPAVISMLFLTLSMFLLSVRWKYILRSVQIEASVKDCIISVGLPIFSKYIPGKVFMIIGKTGYLSRTKGYSVAKMSMAALTDQVLAIVTGLACGSFIMFEFGHLIEIIVPLILIWTLLVIFLLHPGICNLLRRAAGKLLKREINIQMPPARRIIRLLPLHIGFWLSTAAGFYFLISSINTGPEIPLIAGLAFPFAVCAGMLVLIAPGGIGIGESVIIGVCRTLGLNAEIAASIAITSRIWFLLGELIIFVAALFLSILSARRSVS